MLEALQHFNEKKDDVDTKIVVAGLSTTCSQKIHNQLIGVEKMHKDGKYVLFLDDDVRLHPGSIGALTAEIGKNPDFFIQTGYPFDLPSGSLGSYCIYEYHMLNPSTFLSCCHLDQFWCGAGVGELFFREWRFPWTFVRDLVGRMQGYV